MTDEQVTEPQEKKHKRFCSFCNRSNEDVGAMVEGLGDVYICGACVKLCRHVLLSEMRRGNPNVKEIEPEAEDLLDEMIDKINSYLNEANRKIVEARYLLTTLRKSNALT